MNMRHLIWLILPWMLIVIVGLLAWWLRVGLIEPPALAHQCTAHGGPAWCPLRTFAVQAFVHYGYGYAALLAAALTLCWSQTFTAWLAAALGLFALIMYCPDGGALALLIGFLRLARHQAATTC